MSLEKYSKEMAKGCNSLYKRSVDLAKHPLNYSQNKVTYLIAMHIASKLQQELQWVLDSLLQLLHEFAANSTVDDLVVEAASDDNLVVPLDAWGTVL
jgi:gamma-glutamyl-gamma-aminobutyrate hydrolase PuuD